MNFHRFSEFGSFLTKHDSAKSFRFSRSTTICHRKKKCFFYNLNIWGVQEEVGIENINLFFKYFYLLLIKLDNLDTKVIISICHDFFYFPPLLSFFLFFVLLFRNPLICLDDEKVCFCKVKAENNLVSRLSIASFGKLLISSRQCLHEL